jgi:hypothetical protein
VPLLQAPQSPVAAVQAASGLTAFFQIHRMHP